LIPLLGAFWLKPQESEQASRGLRVSLNRSGSWIKDYYLAGLGWALRHPGMTLGGAVLLLIISLGMLRLVGSEMLPRFDSGDFRVLVDMVPGTTLADTLEGVRDAEQSLLAMPYLHSLSTRLGHEAGARAMGNRGAMLVNQAEMTVKLIPRTERELNQWQIMEQLREVLEQTPGILLGVPQEMGGTARASTAAPILVRISGERPEELDRLGDELLVQLAGIPGITDLYKDWSLNTPEIRVHLDDQRVAELGLSANELARAVHQALDGRIATRYRQPPWRDLNVVVRYAPQERAHLEDLENISLMTAHGAVPLRELARLEHGVGTRLLTREDGTRSLDILGFHLGRPLSEVVSDVETRLAGFAPPQGYQVYLVGEQADFDEARGHMIRALLLAAMAVYLLLVVQFRSFLIPVTIMSAIPLQFIGVASALLLAGKYLSMPALLGIILLIGIVVNNSIMLLDVAQRRLAEGWQMDAALIDAVSLRLRPIMMTGMSTIAGMLPLALEMAVGSERFSPIATVIIGGVITATILTLIVVPTLYKVLSAEGKGV
jgi:HAE1 family hydrophobic/amphiphilic exporter-1